MGCTTLLSFSLPVGAEDIDYTKIANGITLNDGENGQKIPWGSTIHHFDNGETEVHNSNNKLILMTSDSDADLVATPGGFMKANHIYGVPSGTIIDHVGNIIKFYKDDQLILTVIDKESDKKENDVQKTTSILPNTGGWVECAKDTGRKPDTFTANWICPSSPPGNLPNIVNFLFTGITTWTGSSIIQPVLQWNQGGAPGWSGAAWYVYSGGSSHSSYCTVSVGQSLGGSMVNYGTTWWFITFNNYSSGSSVSLYVNTNIPLDPFIGNVVYVTLESYNTANGDIYNTDMPGDTTFSNIAIKRNGQQLPVVWYKKMFSDSHFKMTGLDVTWSGNTTVNLLAAN